MGIGFADLRKRRIRREAARWRVEMLEPQSAGLRAEFDAWFAADPAHARAYDELERLTTLATRLPNGEHRRALIGRERALRPAFGMAMAAAIAVGGVLLLARPDSPATEMALTNSGTAIRLLRLSDGSTVTLDVATRLTVTIGPNSREAHLRSGRARFQVADDPGRPFVVSLPEGRVEARGGAFDVALSANRTTVVPVKGEVRVYPTGADQDGAVAVRAGSAAWVASGDVVSTAVSRRERLWPAGRIAFNRTPLAKVVATANRLGGPPIRLGSDAVGSLEVTAVLDLRDTRALAPKIAAALDLKIDERDGSIVLNR